MVYAVTIAASLDFTTAEWLQLGAASASALAAAAAWMSATVNARSLARAAEPAMVVQPLAVNNRGVQSLEFHVYNAGPVAVRRIDYYLFDDTVLACGRLGMGLLRPGDVGVIKTDVRLTPQSSSHPCKGIVVGTDPRGRTWAWRVETDGRRKVNSPMRRRFRFWRRHVGSVDVAERTYSQSELGRLKQAGVAARTALEMGAK